MSAAVQPARRKRRGLTWDQVMMVAAMLREQTQQGSADALAANPWKIADPSLFHPGVLPAGARPTMAHDDAIMNMYTTLSGRWQVNSAETAWLGFPYLAELAVRPEYRRISEGLAREMTRRWIRIVSRGEGDKADKIKVVDQVMRNLKVRDHFRWVAEVDGFMGRAQLYPDLGLSKDSDEQLTELIRDGRKIRKGAFRRLARIEPMWSYPGRYNAISPLDENFYRPESWYVQGREVHASRLLTFVSRPVADILKPAYAFGGLSLSQMAKPYVDNWLRTRQSVSDLIHSFSTPVLMTNMMAMLADGIDGGDELDTLVNRIKLWNLLRDNRDTLVIDKETEDFKNISAPLSGLDKLQAQALEQISAVSGMPLVIFLGITPSGLNASAEGELVAWENFIRAMQETLFGPGLDSILELIQISEWGYIDPDIGYEFLPLREQDALQKAQIRQIDAQTAIAYMDAGVLDPTEERERIAADPESLWTNIDPDVMPEPPEPEMPPGAENDNEQVEESPDEIKGASPKLALGTDATLREADHPREDDGKFTEGGGGDSGGAQSKADLQPASAAGEKGARTQANGEPDPDDEPLTEMPPDVVAILGFDPLTDPDALAMSDEDEEPKA